MILQPAVFLDRDGTLIEERQYLRHVAQVSLLPGAVEAVRAINRQGLPVVVVTNQSGVARGLFEIADVARVHEFLRETFARRGACIDRFYFCPHHPESSHAEFRAICRCRKPAPGMLLQAAEDLTLDLTRSVILGDTLRDIEAGHRAGCRGVLVRTGYGRQQESLIPETALPPACPDFVAEGILEGVRWALERIGESASD